MIRRYYEIECDYCNHIIFSSINRPSDNLIREHCKLIIRNGKRLTFHNKCYDKLENK